MQQPQIIVVVPQPYVPTPPQPMTPLGAKGVAEGNAMSTPACIANAVADALGVAEIPQTPAKAGRLREKRVRGGPARALAICLVQRRRVSRAWRTTLPTVLSSKKRSRLGRAVCNSSGKPTRLYADSRL